MDRALLQVPDETTEKLVKYLDENTKLKDGTMVICLFTMEQTISFIPADRPTSEHLISSTYKSFEYIVKSIYKTPTYADDYIADSDVFVQAVKMFTYN